jgi:hypothetical protein
MMDGSQDFDLADNLPGSGNRRDQTERDVMRSACREFVTTYCQEDDFMRHERSMRTNCNSMRVIQLLEDRQT